MAASVISSTQEAASQSSGTVSAAKGGVSKNDFILFGLVLITIPPMSWYLGNLLAGVMAVCLSTLAQALFRRRQAYQHAQGENARLQRELNDVQRDQEDAKRRWDEERERLEQGLNTARVAEAAARAERDNVWQDALATAHERYGRESVQLVADKVLALDAQAEAERIAREALAARDAAETQLRHRTLFSVSEADRAGRTRFHFPDGGKLSWSEATHAAVIGVKGKEFDKIPIRMPTKERPDPYVVESARLGVELLVFRDAASGRIKVTLTRTQDGAAQVARSEVDELADHALIVPNGSAAVLFRTTAVQAMCDVAVLSYLIGLGRTVAEYFASPPRLKPSLS